MKEEMIIRKLADYILLNAYSVDSTGLYNGKAGLSLCLFEASRYLNDTYLESQAFDLLQESLLSKNEDVKFENGLAGVGYVLLYLINNKFIDADFDELFNDNTKKIFAELETLKEVNSQVQIQHHFKLVYFLCLLNIENPDKDICGFIELFSKEIAQILIVQFSSIGNRDNLYYKIDVLHFFEIYLQMAHTCELFKHSQPLLECYSELYQKDEFVSSFNIGYYLSHIAQKQNDDNLRIIGENNKKKAVLNIHPSLLSLSQRIDLLNLLLQDKDQYVEQIKKMERDLIDIDKLEKTMLLSINKFSFFAGYEHGLARVVLYFIYRTSHKPNVCF